jgi:polyhydroxyalkanoate synthase subunit PhaC
VPWESAYKTSALVSGPVRFVLSSGGHIAGIVNPPSPKAWFLAHDEEISAPGSAEVWRETAQRKSGTWWDDWVRWAGETAGDMIDPPATGSDQYPVLGDAPGRYVHT